MEFFMALVNNGNSVTIVIGSSFSEVRDWLLIIIIIIIIIILFIDYLFLLSLFMVTINY